MDRRELIKAILEQLETELKLQTEAAHAARAEATDEESRAEDKYDMRSQSAAYLAAGQAKFATEIQEAIKAYHLLPEHGFLPDEPIATGAIITLEAKDRRSVYFFGPLHGGLEVKVGHTPVTVVTAASPLGRQLVGRRVHDTVMLPGRTAPLAHTIVSVE